jgi:hypothetical protein
MAAASIANGDYLLVLYAQSASRAMDWYRVACQRRTQALSCDCPMWTFNQHGNRTCKHVDFAEWLLERERPPESTTITHAASLGPVSAPVADSDEVTHPYVTAIGEQFPGLRGHWQVHEQAGRIAREAYQIVHVHFASGNGDQVVATLAFAERHHLPDAARRGEIAIRAGYTIALELAHRRGIWLDVRPPSHYTSASPSARHSARHQIGTTRELPTMEMDHILRIAGTPAAGSSPSERAEGTLRLMLGDTLYTHLLGDGYLDVPSAQYADRRRVYRLRRDSARVSDKRVRVFEEVDGRMTYVKDFCIVRHSARLPEADHFLTKWLGLLSDERSILAVVKPHNIFAPHSDDYGRRIEEPTSPVWGQSGAQ